MHRNSPKAVDLEHILLSGCWCDRLRIPLSPGCLVSQCFARFATKNQVPWPMMERAGMSEMDIYIKTCDIFHYFKLPYDAPPPEE
jgi:hypothetical protein